MSSSDDAPCGNDRISWTFTVDTSGAGESRKQVTKSGFRTRAAAQGALNNVLHALQHRQYVEPEKVTVATFLSDQWLPAKRSNLKPTTIRSYVTHIDRHVVPYIGTLQLQAVGGDRLNELYAKLTEAGLAPASVRRVHAMLSKAFGDAVRWKKLVSNPAAAADPPKLKSQHVEEMAFWTPQQARAFLESVEGDFYASLWRTYLATGMRRGEVLALRKRDVDLDGRTLVVSRSIVTVDYVPQISTPKNGKTRAIDLDVKTVAALRSQMTESRLAMGLGKPSDDDLIFVTPEGKPIHPDSASKMWNAAVKRAGLRRIRLHDTRHTHVAIAIAAGADPKTIQVRLGHHSVAFTLDRYGHLFPARQREIADAVGEALA